MQLILNKRHLGSASVVPISLYSKSNFNKDEQIVNRRGLFGCFIVLGAALESGKLVAFNKVDIW